MDKHNASQSQSHTKQAREKREQTPTSSEQALTDKERDSVAENGNLSSLTVYSIIWREGENELERPKASLWWSGVAAGIGISTSVLVEGIIRTNLGEDHDYLGLFESLGYTFGFVLVILCRLQLFTENTITVILPLLAEPTRRRCYCVARLWSLVFLANLVGTFLAAALSFYAHILSPSVLHAIITISQEVGSLSWSESLLRATPSGFIIAALVWMLPSAKNSQLSVIIMFTWLIAAGGFTHVIAGSYEIFILVLNNDLSLFDSLIYHILPVLLGNIIGGTGLFALLAYGQVHEEMT
ncbi:formate/nitrite transporter family protein [Oceanisphaera avium]|uniref:Transporter (Formate/nitrite transporter family protein) n=1 Tax=Oceanisphaera avium TaxID=1903694 RepID=A0A1Y0CWY9_9GAMM|nr:formate/nitrite transporter family protein [Oceanisphaera avium]ART79365.1 transporter (formate/nitrite transporter family protein) [Oceanisphaera avium]